MKRYIDRDKFMQNLETDKYGFTDCVKVGIALDKAEVNIKDKIQERYNHFKRVYGEESEFVAGFRDCMRIVERSEK